MGDSRDKGGDGRGNPNQSVETQFLEDLERATRLSLETFKTEQEARSNGKRVLAEARRFPPHVHDCNGRKSLELIIPASGCSVEHK